MQTANETVSSAVEKNGIDMVDEDCLDWDTSFDFMQGDGWQRVDDGLTEADL